MSILLASSAQVWPDGPVPTGSAPALKPPVTFLVSDSGALKLLGADGKPRPTDLIKGGHGTRSPDGQWLACFEYEPGAPRARMALQPLLGGTGRITLPLIYGQIGSSGGTFVWSANSKRL